MNNDKKDLRDKALKEVHDHYGSPAHTAILALLNAEYEMLKEEYIDAPESELLAIQIATKRIRELRDELKRGARKTVKQDTGSYAS